MNRVVLLVLMCIFLLPCVASAEDACVVGASYQTLNNVFYITLSEGIREYVEARGGIYIAMDSQVNLQKQTSDVEDLIQLGCDVVIIAPIDSAGTISAVTACRDAGVPVLCVNAGVDSDYVSSTIETDNYLAGVLMARSLIELSDATAKVGMIEYNLNDAGRGRTEGFLDTIRAYPDIEIVARQECDTTTESALPIAEDMLQAHPEITAFFSVNDPTAYGIYAAASGMGRGGDILIFSCDGGSDVVEWLRSGKIQSTVAQFPRQMGQLAARMAYELLAGIEVESRTQVAPCVITAENLEAYEQYLSGVIPNWPADVYSEGQK